MVVTTTPSRTHLQLSRLLSRLLKAICVSRSYVQAFYPRFVIDASHRARSKEGFSSRKPVAHSSFFLETMNKTAMACGPRRASEPIFRRDTDIHVPINGFTSIHPENKQALEMLTFLRKCAAPFSITDANE